MYYIHMYMGVFGPSLLTVYRLYDNIIYGLIALLCMAIFDQGAWMFQRIILAKTSSVLHSNPPLLLHFIKYVSNLH